MLRESDTQEKAKQLNLKNENQTSFQNKMKPPRNIKKNSGEISTKISGS